MRPLIEPTCTYYEKLSIATSFIDCRGCDLNTVELGPGPEVMCGTFTTVSYVETTVISCSPSAGAVHS